MDGRLGLCACVAAWTAVFPGTVRDAAAETAAVALPGVIANFITAGTPDPRGRVPALDAVAGAGVQNIAIASPLALLQHGRVYTLILTSQNNTFGGVCADSYTLKQGTAVLAKGKIHTMTASPARTGNGRSTARSSRTSPASRP